MQEIKRWIGQHDFRGPSNENKDWLQGGREKGEFSNTNLVEAGLYAFQQAEAAVKENMRLREEINETLLPTSEDNMKHFADADDLDRNLTMITEDNKMLVDYKVVKDPRHLRTITAWAKIYHRATDENVMFETESKRMKRTREWFHHPDRHKDRLGLESNELDDPRGFGPRTLKQLAFYGRNNVREKRRQFNELSDKARTEYPGKVDIPNVSQRIFQRQPAPDPNLYLMGVGQIEAYDLELQQVGDSEGEREDKRWRRQRFFQSLAILAWMSHELKDAIREVRDSRRDLRDKSRLAAFIWG